MASDPVNPQLLAAQDADQGERLDRFVHSRNPDLSRSRCKDLIKRGFAPAEDGTIVAPNYRVKPGDRFLFTRPEPEPAVPAGEAIPLNIVYEDDALIVIDKPAGLVVHPAAGNWTGTLVNALIAHCGDSLSGIGGVRRPGIVHRLDKDTGGLLVVAKSDAAHQGLAGQFADHGRSGPLERRYVAVVWGAPARTRATIDKPLERSPASRTKMAVARSRGKRAITHYTVRETILDHAKKPLVSLLECRLETGRTHQIRVHLAHIGHPLLGDRTYGGHFAASESRLPGAGARALKSLNRQALHGAVLGFAHPLTGKHLRFESPLPRDLQDLIEACRGG